MSDTKHPVAEIGKYKVTAKVAKLDIKEGQKAGWIHFEGFGKALKYFPARKTATPLEVGQEAELEYETKDDEYNGETTRRSFLLSFGGSVQSGGKGGGGGYKSSYTPKTPEEIHAPSIGGIVKSVLDYAGTRDERLSNAELSQLIDLAVDRYQAGVRRLSGQSSQPAPAATTLAVAEDKSSATSTVDPQAAVAEAVEYLAVIDIAGKQLEAFKQYCKDNGHKWVNKALAAKKSGIDNAADLYQTCPEKVAS